MINDDEKRDFLRMAIDCNFSFKTANSNRELQGNVINLSEKGILFTSRKNMEVGALLNIVLTPSHTDTAPIHATVIVERVSSTNDFLYEVACKIRSMAPQSDL